MNPVVEPLLDPYEYKYSDEYLLITAEINKLSSNNPDAVEWSIVHKNCQSILEKINDFVLSGYLIFSCLKLKKSDEFEVLLGYLSSLIKNHYNNPQAMPKKIRFKHSALEWLYERIKSESLDFPDYKLNEKLINAILSKVNKLDQVLLDNDINFSFSSLYTELKKKSKLLEQEYTQEESQIIGTDRDISDSNNTSDSLSRQEMFSEEELIINLLQENIEKIKITNKVTADIVNINRSLTWHRVNDEEEDFYAILVSIAGAGIDDIYQVKYLIDQERYMEAVIHLENLFCQYPLSLDIQYYLFICADKINDYLLVEAITYNLKVFINKYPQIIFYSLANSQRCASKKTAAWFEEVILSNKKVDSVSDLKFSDIHQLIRYYEKKLKEKLSVVDQLGLYLDRSWQLAKMNYLDMAISALEKIYKDLNNNPILIDLSNENTYYIKCISLLYHCYSRKEPDSNLQEHQYEIYKTVLENLSVYYPNVLLMKEISDE
ncbi:hypothetical protein AVI51_13820 [Piscirickettsia salmonis]|uniref:Type VI secretion-associated protein, family n=1 Tax=Piscirickettsia salmonis TaxID=1238 RepID=A0A9Q5VFS1_PISSA|nr:type VI secretion system domain-containing protein [Piscirickettsia salmonis]ALA24102.1 Type VI secretion system protein ImpA [Piscirickettsia salmonis]APS44503.1 hypothetical protein AVI48_09080 [Piscirickettsia salmonis]APS47864.1 hypothetical protein AVI49_09685 [Piscirickettsia salmonis]APS51821.1 hypothetical protein AVI50_13950 [Piscirickettsia salmonis]APS55040.1 hypothetical protein AVI51_13820 [Piscirickettsia salmonis]